MRERSARPVLHIVDADASVRDALRRLTHAEGFETYTYASADDFLATLPSRGIGCVLLDSSFLAEDGRMCVAMRARGMDWPVIVLSAGHDDGARDAARSAGARFLLNKPVDAQALFDAIAWVTEGESDDEDAGEHER